MLSGGTAFLLPNSDGFGTRAQQQFIHATQWEVLSENAFSLNSPGDGHFPAVVKRLVLFTSESALRVPKTRSNREHDN
jgi:hypothetical protein